MNRYNYYPKRPVKSFQDLEVYQKTLGLAVEIVKKLKKEKPVSNSNKISKKLEKTVLRVPKLIAMAHSTRFGESEKAISYLEKAMLDCNLAVYYLELFRDLVNSEIKTEYFEEQIQEYLKVRGKIMRLQKSWLKFMGERKC
ncbi:MAG: four helix bundle protein [Patescibacteria group bacterium]